MKNIMKVTKIATKIAEVFHWVGAVLMLAAAVCSLAAPNMVKYFVEPDTKSGTHAEISIYGFESTSLLENGMVNMQALFLYSIGGIIILVLAAMIFRNLNLIIKKAENSTPFQQDNVRMLKEIGIFSMAMPVVGLITSIVCRLVMGVNEVEISVNLSGFFMGLIVLCLTQFFVHGIELEKDVDGLL